jgi:hypothetical protein
MISGSRATSSTPKTRTVRAASALAVVATALSLWGCGDDGEGGDDSNGASAGAVMLTDANNYTSTSVLTLPTVQTAPGADLEICWDAVTQDMQCHPIDPVAGIDAVTFLRFDGWDPAEIVRRLGIGNLTSNEFGRVLDIETDHVSTCAQFSTFDFFGKPVDLAADYPDDPNNTYVLVFAKGTTPGVGAQTMMYIDPTTGETNTRVDAPSGCSGILDFTANIQQVAPITMPAAGPWEVDWSGVTMDSNGVPIPFSQIDSILVGFYQGMTTADLETQFLDIELIATELYEMPHNGTSSLSANLAGAMERTTGAPFAGFTRTDGVWMMAMMCSKCQNPAPLILTIVQPG